MVLRKEVETLIQKVDNAKTQKDFELCSDMIDDALTAEFINEDQADYLYDELERKGYTGY